MKHPPKDHSIFQCNIIDETVAAVHQEEAEEMHMEQDASVGTPPDKMKTRYNHHWLQMIKCLAMSRNWN